MKSTLTLSIFCATFLIETSFSWMGFEKANRTNIKHYEKHCWGTVYNMGAMEAGEVKRIPGTCVQATCLEDRNIKFSGCPLVGLSDRVRCRVYQGDLEKEYPECCYEIRCDETNRTSEVYDGFVNATDVDIRRKAKEKDKKEESTTE